MTHRIMTHLVAFYPDEERSFEVAMGLAEGGASFLEVQFPFSDPQADGPAIQGASTRALEAGFTVDRGFALLERIAKAAGIPVFLMTYGNLPFTRGVPAFVRAARDAGCAGLIVPDLTLPHDEGLAAAASGAGIVPVPVIAPNVSPARLAEIAATRPAYLYAAIRRGITGQASVVDGETLAFLARAATTGAGIFAGFGIATGEQVAALAPYVLAPVVGSAIVRAIAAACDAGKPLRPVTRALAAELAG